MVKIQEQVKAILSGLIAGGGALGTALSDQVVTPQEWTTVAVAALVAYGVVYGVGQQVPVPQLLVQSAKRLSTDQALRLAERVSEREDQERAQP